MTQGHHLSGQTAPTCFGHGAVFDRTCFFALLERAISVAQPDSAPVLIVIDLPGLRDAAPAHASHLSDAVAGRIAEALNGHGFLGAQPAGRFAALIASDGPVDASATAQMLLASLARPIAVDGQILPTGAVLGIVHWGQGGHTAEEMFVTADRAIHESSARVPAALAFPEPVAGVRFVASPLRGFG
jgi:predicted signal transduction protein with EAL and GGDEF domain